MNMSAPKRLRTSESNIRSNLLDANVIDLISSSLLDSSSQLSELTGVGVEIVKNPFPLCIVNNFLSDHEILRSAISDLKYITFHEKSNDLYQFKQSDDLSNLTNLDSLKGLYNIIRFDAHDWIAKIFSSVNLSSNISATISSYGLHDRLLCHDDKCGDRHIAFILYLTEGWKEEFGGGLQLFSTDLDGYPLKIVKTIYPEFNNLVFFEVTHTSFHQVAEILIKAKERISLNGWFHASCKKVVVTNCKKLEVQATLGNAQNYNLEEFFSKTYFEDQNKFFIKKEFVTNSEINLKEFLLPEFLSKIKSDLGSKKMLWNVKGPPNVRKYEVADVSQLPFSLKLLQEIMESKSWFLYLKCITGLDFAPQENSDVEIWEKGILPKCICEIQRWTHSCYSLIHDKDSEFHTDSLDIVLRIPFEESSSSESQNQNDEHLPEAGHIIYVEAESKDEECLLHLGYEMNSLALIYRDAKTLRFTKYLHSAAQPYYQIFCSYYPWSPPADQPNLKHCEEYTTSEEISSDSDDS